jgi:hypothetical protein
LLVGGAGLHLTVPPFFRLDVSGNGLGGKERLRPP